LIREKDLLGGRRVGVVGKEKRGDDTVRPRFPKES